ncbi:MAG: hypothetical protein ACFHX7_10400 [Pseudomonadota bacterium]
MEKVNMYGQVMSGDIIEFDKASGPHVHRRKESRLKAMKQAFRAAREETPAPQQKKRKSKKKGRKK